MDEDEFPLISKSTCESHEASSILRGLFQDILSKPKYPQNIANNVCKYNIQNKYAKELGNDVQTITNQTLLNMDDIGIVEEKLLYHHAKYVLNEELIKDDTYKKEMRRLKRRALIESSGKADNTKYGLITPEDLYPSKIKRCIDFKLNDNKHICDPCATELDLVPMKLAPPEMFNKITHGGKFGPNSFEVNPQTVIFYDYKINTTYKKKFKLKNITSSPQALRIDKLPKSKYFRVELDEKKSKVSPGMSAIFTVYFRSDNYHDIKDSVSIIPITGTENLVVELVSYREAPNLSVFIFKNLIPIKYDNSLDVTRSIALNFNIDCGACFYGEMVQIFLIMKNNGGRAKFFFITEEQWFRSDVDTIHKTNELEAGYFTIWPAYFEICESECNFVRFDFIGAEVGLNLEKVLLMCSNITYEKIDIVADTIVYDKYCVLFDETDLLYACYLTNIIFPERAPIQGYTSSEGSCQYLYRQEVANDDCISTVFSDKENVTISSDHDQNNLLPETQSQNILKYLEALNRDIDPHVYKEECLDTDMDKIYGRFLIYFGVCCTLKSSSRRIIIKNNCPLDLNYFWKVDDAVSSQLGIPILKNLHETCVVVEEGTSSFLPYNSSTQLKVTLTPDAITAGFYMLRLRLYIQDIPKCAIDQIYKFITVEGSKGEKYCHVLAAEFDILCRIEDVIIEFMPHEVMWHQQLHYNEVVEIPFDLRVKNEDKEYMNCTWTVHRPEIEIVPDTFSLRENQITRMIARIKNTGYDHIMDTAELKVNNLFTKVLKVHVLVQPPTLFFQQKTFDFGTLELGNVYSKKLRIINNNYVALDWNIYEDFPDTVVKKNPTEIKLTNLENGEIEMEYIIHAVEETDWTSSFNLNLKYNDMENLNDICQLTYKVEKPCIRIHTEMSECPIVCPNEVLFINERSTYTVCIHNLSDVDLFFYFGEAYGTKIQLIDVVVGPSSGKLARNGVVQVSLCLTPQALGILDEVYMPCMFKNCNNDLIGEYNAPETISLILLCVVEDIYVKITVPSEKDEDGVVVLWPPQMIYDFDYEYLDESYIPPGELDEDQIEEHENMTSIISTTQLSMDVNQPVLSIEDFSYADDIRKYLNAAVEDANWEEESSPKSEISDMTSHYTDNVPRCKPLKEYFDETLVVQENVIEIIAVPLRTVVTRTIKIENITPLCGYIQAEVMNFAPQELKRKRIDNVLEKLKMKQSDEWSKILPLEGILIKADLESNELKPFGHNTVTISIYANTWGIYADELLIEVNNILPFCVTILVEVIGLPLEFPITMNTINKSSIFRFGVIPYKSKEVTRRIYIRNTSVVPVSVVWHIFMKNKRPDNEPITILFDVCHPEDHAVQGNLFITSNWIVGKSEENIFQLGTKETYIKAQETVSINVSFNPKMYIAKFQTTNVEAYLVGYIQLPVPYRQEANLYTRRAGSEMQPCQLKLMLTMELPKLELEMLHGDLCFVYYATELFKKKFLSDTRVLVFKNFHQCPTTINMEITWPFKVTQLRTFKQNCSERVLDVLVKAGECVEVEINLFINMEMLTAIAETVYFEFPDAANRNSINYDSYSYSLEKNMEIKQKGFLKQSIPLEITIYFPRLEVPELIDFGIVFVGNTKKTLFTIKNFTAHPVPYFLTSNEPLNINPTEGVIDAAKRNPSFVDISLIFIPTEYKVYEWEILVSSNVPQHELTIQVRGVGNHDEKHFTHDLC